MTLTPPVRVAMPPATVVLLLTLLLGIQPIATDLYLPTLPALQADLGSSVAAAQLTLSALVIAFGVTQLLCGPMADRWGRRPVLLAGLALFTLASIGGALASSIDLLVAWRVLQGVAMAAAVSCARAIVRDLYPPLQGAQVMSRALTGLGLLALMSPLAGGAIAQWLDWRVALQLVALFGAACLALVAWQYRETLPRPDPQATHPARLWHNWGQVLGHRSFRAWAALLVCTYSGLFFMLAASAFVYQRVLGVSGLGVGLVLAAMSITFICGTFLCRRWLPRFGLRGAVKRGALFTLASGLGMVALSLSGWWPWWAMLACQCLFTLGHGIHQPCGQAGAVGPFPDKAGTAASLSGFLMMLVAFCIGLWLGANLQQTVYPLTLGVALSAFCLVGVAWTLVQRDGDPQVSPVLPAAAAEPGGLR